jgi:hypothetical protein
MGVMSGILLPFCFILFLVLGATYGGFAAYQYFRLEREVDIPRLPVAMGALGLQYFFMFAAFALGGYHLAPTILMFFTAMALITTVWLGLAARTVGGTRIAISGLFTFIGYACLIVGISR